MEEKDYEAVGWATILEPGQTIGKHDHNKSDWAAVWQVTGDTNGGKLCLTEPEITFEVWPGALILFPGTTEHWVEPAAIHKRVSVALNINLN